MKTSKRRVSDVSTLHYRKVASLVFIVWLFLFAASQHAAAQGTHSDAASDLHIHLLLIFDHEQLITWPPTAEKREEAAFARQKLISNLNRLRPNVISMDRRNYAPTLKTAAAAIERGRLAYEKLKHREAAVALEQALSHYIDVDYHLVAPEKVSQVLLLLGKTRLEQGMETEAERLFRSAFELDPTLQVRKDFEHPNTVAVLQRARRSFLTRMPERPSARVHSTTKGNHVYIHGRVIQRRLELVIRSATGVRLEVEPIDGRLDNAISRISSRVMDCLPVKDQPALAPSSSKPNISAGIGTSFYSSSPVGFFPIADTVLSYSHPISQNIDVWVSGRLSTSGRDAAEHLRKPLYAARLTFGPRPRFTLGNVVGTIHLLPWVGRTGDTEITTNPACKFFSESSNPPAALCNHATDVERLGSGWVTGLEIGTGISVPLSRRFILGLNATLQFKLVEEISTDFKYLYGSTLTLGYRL